VLTTSDAATYLIGRGLLASSESPSVTEFSGGVSGVTLLVETPRIRLVVKQALEKLRTTADWTSDPRRSLIEARALQAFAALSPQAAPVVLDVDPERCAFTMTAAPHGTRPWKDVLLAGDVRADAGRRLGELLGRWHRESAESGDARFDDTTWFQQLRVDPFYERLMQVRPDLRPAIRPLVARLLARREVLVHGDFSPKNVLVHPDGTLWLIDFEVCHRGDPVFDLAFVLHHLVLKAVHRPQSAVDLLACAEAILAGYVGERPGELPMEYLVAHVGCLALARVLGTSPATYLTDDDKDRLVAHAVRLVREPARTLGDAWPGSSDMTTWEDA
jgi:5-methylthioribose kinase